jgi:uncharacterized GH25 family protein
LLAVLCAHPVAAHDFWVQPEAYWLAPDTSADLTLQVGHGPYRQRSPIPLRRIVRYQGIAPDGTRLNLRDNLHVGQTSSDGAVGFHNAGTYLLVLETDDRAQVHLPAIRFNDYLKVEGLIPAIQERLRTHRMDADGSENYSRCAKSIIQVGTSRGESSGQISKPVGLPLEIVPEISPYTKPRSATLPVQVIYHGQPLKGALVKLTNLKHDEVPFETQVTDETGHAIFTMPVTGSWLLNVIWTAIQPSSSDTDFETTFSSLSFGLDNPYP